MNKQPAPPFDPSVELDYLDDSFHFSHEYNPPSNKVFRVGVLTRELTRGWLTDYWVCGRLRTPSTTNKARSVIDLEGPYTHLDLAIKRARALNYKPNPNARKLPKQVGDVVTNRAKNIHGGSATLRVGDLVWFVNDNDCSYGVLWSVVGGGGKKFAYPAYQRSVKITPVFVLGNTVDPSKMYTNPRTVAPGRLVLADTESLSTEMVRYAAFVRTYIDSKAATEAKTPKS